MLEPLLRTFALVASCVVVLGWGLWAIEEARSASDATTTQIAGLEAGRTADPPPQEERARERAHSGPREAIDDANDVLLSPFAAVAADAEGTWLRRTVPAAIALLVYGLGLGFLARFAGSR